MRDGEGGRRYATATQRRQSGGSDNGLVLSHCEESMNQLLSFSSSYPWSAMNDAGPSHNLNENLELHDAPVINDEVLENSESDGDDDNDNIQSSSDDDVNDDTNMSRPMTDSLHVVNECVSQDMTNWVDNAVANEYFIENEETEWMHTANVQVDNLNIIWEPYVLEDLSHVAAICKESSELWRAHVPMFCMAVMEVHIPERVWRQFGAPQVIPPAPERYDRKDGHGHARENWLLYHARNIEMWNDRANTILEPPTQEEDQSQWRQWYGQQSNLYLTPFSEEPPTEYCLRGPIECALVDVTFPTRELLITNPEASYLDVKKEILKLQEDTLNKLQIKIPEYE
ncbi:hypothetical protein Taro_048084 [Colocasia esculenta]|uniref:Aminotransferase-like plant mobile domain-containing protein n=1 Tax=Colocasia esculenta TaxID=4460 RepID=A0A843X274_COLES|nr:hypothetical protein [Colocasia esculenta]